MFLFGITLVGLIGAIAAGVAAGILIAKLVQLTFNVLINKIKQKLAKRNVSKVGIGSIKDMIDKCPNIKTVSELEEMQKQGITHITAEVQTDGTIDENNGIELWNDQTKDKRVADYIDATGDGWLVVSA